MSNAYVYWTEDGKKCIMYTDLTRTDSHFIASSDDFEEVSNETLDDITEDSDEECIGCETGADCPGAHTEACNRSRGFA
tara:strand:- start:58 stop:294 length:237 start_codon:yes stop_codon:yes gene_type:complete